MKKIVIAVVVLLVVGVGALFAINGKSHYDPSRYSLEIEPQNSPFGVGSSISFTLPDQFDKAHSLSPDTKKLIFVFTKATGHTFKSYMSDKPASFLDKRKIVAVADISGMPTVIFNTFALPDFRKSSYTLLLIHDKNMAKRLKENRDTKKIVVMSLERGKVTKIDYATDEKSLGKLIEGEKN